MNTKSCSKCHVRKRLEAYDKIPRSRDGRRGTCRRCRENLPPALNGNLIDETKRYFRPLDSKRYLITAAQNNTLAHTEFMRTLKVAAKHLKAELVIIPYRYKNPTGMQPGRDLRAENLCAARHNGGRCLLPKEHAGQHKIDELWWDPAVEPFLHNVRKKLNPNLVLAADVKVQATGVRPLSGFESMTGAESCVIGHPKMQFLTVPVPTGRYPKTLTTTGACTIRNYSNTKAGALGEFHHCLGALIVEIDGPIFHIRQINADRLDGSFTDLDLHFTPAGVTKAPPALALVMGDTHVRVTDPVVDKATFGKGGMLATLNPKTLVWHDVFDGETVNHHDKKNPFISEAKRRAGRQEVKAELAEMVEFVNTRASGRNAVIVDSNHHAFLVRWMIETDWRNDLKNADFYLETARVMVGSAHMTPGGADFQDPFPYWVKKLGAESNIRCLREDESFKVSGIECSLHGNNGPNGARGSLKNLSRLGCRVISGHTHTPGIEEGHYQVGTSTPRRQTYMRGPGSHLNTHCVVYASGKRALISIIEGQWRAKA